jgi:hypothetical protein
MCFLLALLAFGYSTDAKAGAEDHRKQDEHRDHRDERDPYLL